MMNPARPFFTRLLKLCVFIYEDYIYVYAHLLNIGNQNSVDELYLDNLF